MVVTDVPLHLATKPYRSPETEPGKLEFDPKPRCLLEGAWRCSGRRAPDKEHLGRPEGAKSLSALGFCTFTTELPAPEIPIQTSPLWYLNPKP